MATGFVVFGHGSSVESANDAVRQVATIAAAEGHWVYWETAFLEAAPMLPAAVEKLLAAGVTDILVLPYFLTLGIHLKRDLPAIADKLAQQHGITVRIAPPLDGHKALSQILVERAQG
ncbi:MAG: cobalamin [Bryobacterales bacterium]|nr:cobalamin [Bryobacterales bacterium]